MGTKFLFEYVINLTTNRIRDTNNVVRDIPAHCELFCISFISTSCILFYHPGGDKIPSPDPKSSEYATWLEKKVTGFFAVGHCAVKNCIVPIRLGHITLVRFGFFLTENCPTAKNPRARKKRCATYTNSNLFCIPLTSTKFRL